MAFTSANPRITVTSSSGVTSTLDVKSFDLRVSSSVTNATRAIRALGDAFSGKRPGQVLMDKILTAQQVAEMLELTPKTLYRWRRAGFGPPAFKAGQALRYRACDVSAWIAEQQKIDSALRAGKSYA